MSMQGQHFYEFGPFRLDPSERLLLRANQPIQVPPKAFETLLLLVRNSGHVLTKEELMKALWPDTFVEENNLTQHISILRRALGETSGAQAYIETVPRLGYRFVEPVRAVPASDDREVVVQRRTRTRIVLHQQNEEEIVQEEFEAEPVAAAPATRSLGKRFTTRTWIAVGGAAAAALAIAFFVAIRAGGFSLRPAGPRTLAVLPFRNLKHDTESQFLSHSLADAITQRLGYFSELVVRPSSYAAHYGNGGADPRTVARELDVQTVLTGSYIKEGDRLRVSAELVDVATAAVLWRDTLDLPFDQLLTVQDRVAVNVARRLRLHILPQESARLSKSAPKDARAYEYFLRALFDISNDYQLSIQMLEASVALDPGYAPAWMALGNAYAGHAVWQGAEPEFREKSREAFDRALQLDPELPGVHVFLAVHEMERGELDQGLLALREELRLNPNEPAAHWWLTEAYLYGGMLQESIAEGERALRLDPLANTGSSLNSYLHAGDYDKFLSSLPMGESARTSFYRGLCYLYMRESSRAAVEFEHAYTLDPSLLHAKYGRAFLYGISGKRDEGVRYLTGVARENPTVDGEMLYKLAQAFATLGDKSSALSSLQAAVDHSFYCSSCMAGDPLLATLRQEPAYTQVMSLAHERHQNFQRRYF